MVTTQIRSQIAMLCYEIDTKATGANIHKLRGLLQQATGYHYEGNVRKFERIVDMIQRILAGPCKLRRR